jgi:hypothetical protein
MAATVENLSESLWLTAFGLMVGITSLLSYQYLSSRSRTFDHEMEDASLGLVAYLTRHRGRFAFGAAQERPTHSPMFGERSLAELSQDRKFSRRSIFLASTALFVAWFVEGVRYFDHDFLTLNSAAYVAGIHVLFMLGFSFFPAYPVWIKLLHRRRGGLVALSSVFCLCWGIIELVFPHAIL